MSTGAFESLVDTAPSKITNPNIFKLEQKRKHVLCHEIGAGSPCTKCDCPGLELHFWRKICKVCSCRMDEHDVHMPDEFDHGQLVIGRLFGVNEKFESLTLLENNNNNNNTNGVRSSSVSPSNHEYAKINKGPKVLEDTPASSSTSKSMPQSRYNYKVEKGPELNKTVTEYAWVPVDNQRLVEKYMASLPEDERPVLGTQGEQLRRQRLAYQLPLYDTSVEESRLERTDEVRQLHHEFVDKARHNAGIGKVIEVPIDRRGSLVDSEAQTEEDRSLPSSLSQAAQVFCHACTKEINHGDVGVRTDHSKDEELWHPGCFRCAQCAQLLVDMLYFFHDGKYYCGRHFADQQYPRCSGCDECDIQLGGLRYMTRNDNPYCIDCYMKHFARTCDGCKEKIGPDEKRLNYQELHWHADPKCFHCTQCSEDLINKKFILKEHHLFCSTKCRVEFFENIN